MATIQASTEKNCMSRELLENEILKNDMEHIPPADQSHELCQHLVEV